MNEQNLAREIRQQFEDDCAPFPSEDVRKLGSISGGDILLFHGQLEMHLSTIAGYASRADRLGRRPRAELIEAGKYLSQSFFEKYPSLAVYRDAITQDSTPQLFRDLLMADKLRQELLVVINGIMATSS